MKSKEALENELALTVKKIKAITNYYYDDIEDSKTLVSVMDFNDKKKTALRSVKNTLEWMLSDTELDLTSWGREKYEISKKQMGL